MHYFSAFNVLVANFWRRFAFATVIWFAAWPVIMFILRGDITGPQAWFWIIGALNYPVIAIVFVMLDGLVKRFITKPWVIFLATVTLIAVCMPFYYEAIGFTLGVSVEARFL